MSLRILRLITAGESHGPAQSGILEGLPSGLELSLEEIQHQLKRRQLGFGRGGRMKIETDEVEFTAGIRFGKTLGSPLHFIVRNRDFQNWKEQMAVWGEPPENPKNVFAPRPGHADLAGGQKYDQHDLRNILERASARETVIRTAAGAICKQMIAACAGIEIVSHVVSIGNVATTDNAEWEGVAAIQNSDVLRCIDSAAEKKMVELIEEAKRRKETLGGTFEVVARNVPPGLGSHVQWDRKLDGRIGQAFLSIPAVKGISLGDAFQIASVWGSEAHDEIFYGDEGFYRKTNRAGGIEGGITNGQEIRILAALKPLSTLMKPLQSVDVRTKEVKEAVVERSDVCSVPAAGVIGEAMLALVLADAILEKFSSDTMADLISSIEAYKKRLLEY
ncbi:MAG TPA: chorismate synthase [Acidobacteriota bacterium]|nr:chorismate synthase [Acidobacteriota bacterium]